jgi:hypothetical protein
VGGGEQAGEEGDRALEVVQVGADPAQGEVHVVADVGPAAALVHAQDIRVRALRVFALHTRGNVSGAEERGGTKARTKAS